MGTEYIAKKVCQTELNILKLLRSSRPEPEHIIPLIDSFQCGSVLWAILPLLAQFREVTITSHVGIQMCWDLVEAVAYLHNLGIAHRDIKLENLLIDRNYRLMLNDFSIAIQVATENTEVSDYCGTTGWMAPELVQRRSYSPIRADRWSLGLAIIALLEISKANNRLLVQKAKELMANNPQLRPSLRDWRKPA
jgi:serine/threonine protein kinase